MKQIVEESIGRQIIVVATMAALLEAGDRSAGMTSLLTPAGYVERAAVLYSSAFAEVVRLGDPDT